MIKLIASDLDGTIIDKNNSIYENNFKAIDDISKKNMDFVICTGKTYPIIKDLCSTLNANYGIFGNGNHIVNLKTGEEIYKKLLTKNEVLTTIDIAKENNLHVHVYTNSDIITEELLYMDLRNFKLKEDKYYKSELNFNIVNDIKSYLLDNDIEVSKLVISSKEDLTKIHDKINKLLDVSITQINKTGAYKDIVIDKEYTYLDISPKNVNKSTAIDFLSNYLKVNKEEIMAIGDNMNDLDMIKNSGVGIAVANAYDEVKNVAKYTTQNPVETGGFAEAIYKFIEF